ncbi:MFS general substrate transporter [Neofusicoccum parvum]|uniref:MFS general substrate transporter n=1 Tax=Neofusicoccum parvum TaxID=310453 RepID=A0ACB5RR24_9PEZI|nr:MFS general substrate transporter [Neofusicoccum parvum]
MFLDLANLSAITIALPTIQEDFNVDVGNLQWVISAYALTFGGFLLLGGRGGDIFGHRRVLLFGMVFFALFTMVCALSPTFIGLVVARAFQGIGAAFTIPPAQAHIALHFTEPAKKAKALGIWGASGSLGFIVGLILGGVLTAFLGWRWIFWISLILSGLVIPAAYLILPRVPSSRAAAPPPSDGERVTTRPPTQKKLTQSVRILLLTYALTSANSVGWNAPQIIATLIVSLVLLFFFILHERSAPQAILAPHLFRNLSFNLIFVLAVNTYAVRQACTYFLTVQLQSFGNSAIHTSVLFTPLGISAFIFNTLSGRLVPILGARAMFVIGWGLSIPGVLLFAFIDEHTSYWRFTFPGMILYIAGIGAVYIAANFVIVSSASKSNQGAAAGVFNVALQVGGSVLGLAVLTAVAEGIEKTYGDSSLPAGTLSHVGYQSVYFSCAILCFIGFLLSVFAITVPESMRGTIWKKRAVVEARGMPVDNASDTYELQHTNVREN